MEVSPDASSPSERRLRLVHRCLPPELSPAEYEASIAKWLPSLHSFRFERGSVPEFRQAVTLAVAYLRFHSSEAALGFSREMDGAAYRDGGGRLTRGEVEWAAVQRVPSSKPKRDRRAGSIVEDAHYKAWEEGLSAAAAPAPSAEQLLEAREKERGKKGVVITPLMQYLKDKQAKKVEKAERERRMKQQAALKERQMKLLAAQQEAREAARRKLASQTARGVDGRGGRGRGAEGRGEGGEARGAKGKGGGREEKVEREERTREREKNELRVGKGGKGGSAREEKGKATSGSVKEPSATPRGAPATPATPRGALHTRGRAGSRVGGLHGREAGERRAGRGEHGGWRRGDRLGAERLAVCSQRPRRRRPRMRAGRERVHEEE